MTIAYDESVPLCERDGHVLVNDDCWRPEHVYCVVCDRPQPQKPDTLDDGHWYFEAPHWSEFDRRDRHD